MKEENFSFARRIKSFAFALNGLRVLIKEEHNARIHLLATLLIIFVAILFELNTYEWIAIIFSIGLVITVEIINTVVENIADFLTTEKNNKIKIIKDLSASAVFISVVTAISIGLIVFIPKIVF